MCNPELSLTWKRQFFLICSLSKRHKVTLIFPRHAENSRCWGYKSRLMQSELHFVAHWIQVRTRQFAERLGASSIFIPDYAPFCGAEADQSDLLLFVNFRPKSVIFPIDAWWNAFPSWWNIEIQVLTIPEPWITGNRSYIGKMMFLVIL